MRPTPDDIVAACLLIVAFLMGCVLMAAFLGSVLYILWGIGDVLSAFADYLRS